MTSPASFPSPARFSSRAAKAPYGCIVVAAHPDDEAIGFGAHLREMRDLSAIIHVTDGAPRRGDDVRNAGCERWEQYAALRRQEFQQALLVSEAQCGRTMCLWYPDQQAIVRLVDITRDLAELFENLRPKLVFTHPYEGGHPDHDTVAAAVHAARQLLKAGFEIMEFASYHAGGGGIETETFLAENGARVNERPLTAEDRRRKRAMFDCYASQRAVLDQFPLQNEPLRVAPRYDFSQPPHEGSLFYEQFDWGVTGRDWRALAGEAFRILGLRSEASRQGSQAGWIR